MKDGLLHDGLEYWRRHAPDRLAIVLDGTDSLTYAELARWSDGIAAQLLAHRVQPGARVGISGSNSLAWVATAFAVLKCGGMLCPMNERFVASEFAYLTGFCEPALIVADAPRRQILASTAACPPLLALEDVEACRDGAGDAHANWRPVRVDVDTPAMMVFTSGSSGTPKGVLLSHREQLGKFFEMTLVAPELGPQTQSLMPLSVQSAPGTAWGYLFSSVIGGTFHFMRKYSAERVLSILVAQRISFFVGFPMLYLEVARLPAFAQADLSALAFARCGGAVLPMEAWDAWHARGVVVRALYGMTETGGGALIATPQEALAKPMSCGRGMPFTQVRIVREDGCDCAPHEAGEVLLRSPGTMLGYWRNPEATARTLVQGWLRTGDIGLLDEEGYFFFVDRAKEIVKCGGFNVSPLEVENVIRELPAVQDVAVFSVSDTRYIEVPFACVVRRGALESQEVFDHCQRRLANFKLPRYVVFVDGDLPRIAGGKVDRQGLKRSHADAQRRLRKLGTDTQKEGERAC